MTNALNTSSGGAGGLVWGCWAGWTPGTRPVAREAEGLLRRWEKGWARPQSP